MGTDLAGNEYTIDVTCGIRFRVYDGCGRHLPEVVVEDGAITFEPPDEMDEWQARAYAALLEAAADQLETDKVRYVLTDAGRKAVSG